MTGKPSLIATRAKLTASQPVDHETAPLKVHERRSDRAQHLRIEVHADHSVWLVIPRHCSRAEALDFLAARGAWVQRAHARLASRPPPAPVRALAWDGDDRIPLRGTPLPLRRVDSRLARLRVRQSPHGIEVMAPTDAPTTTVEHALGSALQVWARNDAQRWLTAEAATLGVDWLGPRIADQRSRWGSCAASGLISLNWRLVMAPPQVLRYVVVHELCHRIHANHSARFWALVAQHMPGCDAARAWLKANGRQLQGILPAR
ncbi:MAG TPA: SprT family zinc-dependent metalloprotease [Nevskiaceae bacterium]|nr:SprT family zinc-dependent metalloprotease [Nevskiaceae bacterium]